MEDKAQRSEQMKESCRTRDLKKNKHYRKNTLSRRIRRVSRWSNTVSTLVMMVLFIAIIGSVVGFLGHGFSSYTADRMAEDVQETFDRSMDHHDFKMMLDKAYSDDGIMDDEAMEEVSVMLRENGDLDALYELEMTYNTLEDIRFFDYAIILHDRPVYDSFMANTKRTEFDQFGVDTAHNTGMFNSAEAFYYDENGEAIGKVVVNLSSFVIFTSYAIAAGLALLILMVNTILNRVITGVTSRVVSRPLEALAEQMENLSNEELEVAFDQELDIRNPVSEVDSLMKSTSKIMEKMSEYYQTMMAQNEELEAQRDLLADHRDELEAQKDELEAQKDELEAQNDQLVQTSSNLQSMNNAYLSRTLKLQNLMDNIGQGFMTFGESLIINSEYSTACETMLSIEEEVVELKGKKVTDLLIDDPEQKEFIESLMVKIIKGSNHERELFMPLLPDELYNNGRVQHVEYKIVKDEHFQEQMMVIITDITHTRDLEAQMSREQDVLKMIVKVLLNRDDFIELVNGFRIFIGDVFGEINIDDEEATLRAIHTYKGSFSQYYLNNISTLLNDMESSIYDASIEEALNDYPIEKVRAALHQDMEVIEGYVGNDFLRNSDHYTVKESKILEIEEKIRKILPASDYNKILPIIKSIRYKSVKEGLKTYPDYVTNLSARYDKSIVPFEITGDDIFVDFEVYQPLMKSMVHLFRNAVDHGIEDMDTRASKDKDISAVISCDVKKTDRGSFTITVRDDGRGIDPEAVAVKALAKGIIDADELMKLTDEDKQNLIFSQGFTTKEIATALSGRGVGLAAVLEETQKLGGKISLNSVIDQGSTFVLELPMIHGTDIIVFEPEDFIVRIEDVGKHYFRDLNLPLGSAKFFSEDRITLQRVNALLNIKGSIDGILVLSVNEAFSNDLIKAFILDEVSEDELSDYAEDVLGEVANTIMGNVLGSYEEEGVHLNLGVPVMLSNRSAYIKYSNRQILSARYETGKYVATMSLLLTDSRDPEVISDLLEIPELYSKEENNG